MPSAALPLRLPHPTAPSTVPSAVPSPETMKAFFVWLLSVLPRALAIEAIAWIVTFFLLVAMLRGLKSRMKPSLMQLDDNVRSWAKTLRFKALHPDASPETARRAAQLELATQHRAHRLDIEESPLPPPLASESPSGPTLSGQAALEHSAAALVESIDSDQGVDQSRIDSGQRLWIDGAGIQDHNGDGRDDRDRDRDGIVSRAERIAAALDDEDGRERVPLTWFFRFWTNFASAPCLCALSLAVPLIATQRAGGVSTAARWLARALPASLPGSFAVRALASNLAPAGLAAVASGGLSAQALRAARIWTMPGLCYSGAMLLSFWLKRIFKRLRPQRRPGAFGHKLKDGSFPSGHSLTSFCFWTALSLSSFIAGTSGLGTLAIALVSLTVVSMTGLSRVYLGVHFPTDVLGGYFIGLTWCLLSLPALRWALHLK